ncbi:MAG: beta-lactamase family protein [Acidobacteria bacterium]|nr:beta-lactamase family protein [Acidobacteriota bacterium]MBS1865517.1 beta-lactamase family protein [Acidobacteriota bacterium]
MKRTVVHALFFCSIAFVFSQQLHAQAVVAAPRTASTESSHAAAIEHARNTAKEWLARGIPGFNVAVAIDGKIVYSEGFGLADLEERTPATQITKFRIGSISKPLTSAALMKLVEAGRIDLDAPIQKYVPTFPDKGALITPRMLAGHLGGIRHYKENEPDSQKHYDSVVAGLERFQNDPLVVPPGTKFSYSSYGYNLLSAAIEAAAGEPFLAYEQEEVFTPLGLLNTVADQPADIIPQRARFYSGAKGEPAHNSMYVDNSYKWAGGGFLSTSEDLVRFGSALFQPGYLKAESLALLFTPQKTKDGKETPYGMGWFIGISQSGKRIFEHSGGSVGGTSELILYPDRHLAVAFVCNYDGESWKREEVQSLGEAFEK